METSATIELPLVDTPAVGPFGSDQEGLTSRGTSAKIKYHADITTREDRGEGLMVVQCPNCLSRYRVADESRVPVHGIGVRCPSCANIFTIYRVATDIELIPFEEEYQEPGYETPPAFKPTPKARPAAASRPMEEPSSIVEESVFEPKPEVFEPVSAPAFEPPITEVTRDVTPEVITRAEPEPAKVQAAPIAEPEVEVRIPPELQKQHDKAKRLARVLVKDILLYHGDKVEEGLRNGNLIDMVGDEIKKSWQYYKSELPEDILSSTNYFKEALNNILAKGKKIFT
jgi:predicted Zn finger-like uncharacterized protein